MNTSVTQGIFPDFFKIARVTPIFKANSPENPTNYRPISILSPISKVYESIIYKRLTNFLNSCNILTKCQFGFRKNHSTALATAELNENMLKNLDDKVYTCGIFLDLSKAFDSVSHNIIIHKLEYYGIRGNTLKLLTNYLTNRQQYTVVQNSSSSLLKINCGVPQGSTLGPLLLFSNLHE